MATARRRALPQLRRTSPTEASIGAGPAARVAVALMLVTPRRRQCWHIHQSSIPIPGIRCRRFAGLLHFLMQFEIKKPTTLKMLFMTTEKVVQLGRLMARRPLRWKRAQSLLRCRERVLLHNRIRSVREREPLEITLRSKMTRLGISHSITT